MQMKKNIQVHHVLLIAAFFVMVSIPLITKLVGLEYNTKLRDVTIASKPAFTFNAYWQQTYQDEYDHYYSTNLGNYGALIKCYTQLRFSAFGLFSGENIQLKDGSIIREQYITEYLGLYDHADSQYSHNLYEKIKRLDKELDSLGKDLIVVITPSKAAVEADQIPDTFLWKAVDHDYARVVDSLVEDFASSDIPFINGTTVAEQALTGSGIPVFYRGGEHATKPAMFAITEALVSELSALGYNMKRLSLIDYVSCKTPVLNMDDGRVGWSYSGSSYNSDNDLLLNCNLLRFDVADTYYYPRYEVEVPDLYDLPNICVLGRSFCKDIWMYLSRSGLANKITHIGFEQRFMDSNANLTSYQATTNMADWYQNGMDGTDIVVLELNESYMRTVSKHIDDFLAFLESYQPKHETLNTFSCSVPSPQYTNYVRGFYKAKDPAPSEGFYWMMKNGGSVNLSANGKFKPKTIVLDCSIPAGAFQTFWQKDVSGHEYLVYINGQKVGSFPVGKDRRETFCFDLQGIDAPDGEYCVEIIAPLYVQWKDIDAKSTDSRELSLRVYSCSLSAYTVAELEEGTI